MGLQTEINQADRRGDFAAAVHGANECIAISKGNATALGYQSGNPFCVYYLTKALREGRGVSRDEARAFALVKEIAGRDPDSDAAVDLAEYYLDGTVTPHDPVEAAVVLWRVKHGTWSFYSDTWGLCNDCGELWARVDAVDTRIARELTSEERQQAALIATDRFPEIAARVKRRDQQVTAFLGVTFLIGASLAGCLSWWRLRREN